MKSNVSLLVFIFASLIISDVFSANILKKSSNVRMVQMLEKLEFNSHFGKSLINVVQLKLKTGGSIDQVYALLDDLVSDIQEQQSEADDEHETKNVDWNNQIETYTTDLAALNADLNEQQANLADYQGQNLEHQDTYDSLVATGKSLANQLESLNDWWVNFADSYSVRQAERQRVLDALDTIITKLTERYNAGSFIQLKDLVSSLKAVKAQKNPILSLVELTLSFNPATVKNVIDRLSDVRDSVQTGYTTDSAYYDEEKNDYELQKSNLEGQISDNTDAQNAEVVTLADLRNKIADTEENIASDEAEIANNETLLANTQNAQTTYNTIYTQDSAIRADEITVIQHVQEILSSNDSNLRKND